MSEKVGLMRCRHTLPDWHRFVAAGMEGGAILAGCRLLVKDGERVSDPRTIACAYWGRQRECPLYDGPDRQENGAVPARNAVSHPADEPVAPGTAWPVRPPGSVDGQRALLMVMAVLSVVLLGSAIAFGVSAATDGRVSTGAAIVLIAAVLVSGVTHVLSLLHLWVGR